MPADETASTDGLVREFHEAFDLPVETGLGPVHPGLARARMRLIRSEYDEVREEFEAIILAGDFEAQQQAVVRLAKELADLRYVIEGAALTFGIDMVAVMHAVHESNMSKLGDDGKPVYADDGHKVLKGPNYREPDIAAVLNLCVEGTVVE